MNFSGFASFCAVTPPGAEPRTFPGETLVEFVTRLDAWKNDGPWTPASGGTETPFLTRSGKKLLYCYQARSGRHAYLDVGSDHILTDAEAASYLSTY